MAINDPVLLIVDDSSTTRHMIQRVIEMTGLPVGRIEHAPDGQAALAILNSTLIDLVLADLNMPVMDGFEMIRQMRQSESLAKIPVVVISAQPDTKHIERLKADGVAGYLPKPFTAESVRRLIEPLLCARQLHAAAGAATQFNMNLAEALAEALETMAFISPVLEQETTPPLHARTIKVDFSGAGGTGRFTLAVPRRFGALVAANCNVQNSDPEGDDALKELANITCGLLLRKRIGGAEGFEMSPPAIAANDDSGPADNKDSVRFNADGFSILATVSGNWDGLTTQEGA